MKTLTKEQIESVIEWMNTWEQLKDTAIPMRFKEDYTKQLQQADVSFSIFDKVYMDSPFGIYTGIVKDIKEGKMTIESRSPTGNGTMWADYDIEGTEWKKYCT